MQQYDFLVVGSGFAGSITAMALKQSGYEVCMVERGRHPRFAIGESSTPIADMILRTLSDKYSLPKLKSMSRYGTWQESYSEVVCGLKRGFSYYMHQKNKPFQPDAKHSRELLVAASENNQNSDTNWLRADVDQFLFEEAKAIGVECHEEATVEKMARKRNGGVWRVYIKKNGEPAEIECSWIVDATGSTAFSNRFFGTKTDTDGFYTHSSAIFTHFENVPGWIEKLESLGARTDDYPYQPDESALHQVLEEGWLWMLRFNNGLLSAGLVLDGSDSSYIQRDPKEIWESVIDSYPSLKELFRKASFAEIPGHLIETGRMQRK
ncbi:MAG: FAD-dependent oxidoreductase, partial [Bacteroidetes bacterium]|nr:FAD-dependent oxidoreductase [Bacteroidota bacterium]